jgi:DNA polymerase II large subunit
MSEPYRRYVQGLEEKFRSLYAVSDETRKKGFDPELKTECKLAKDLADLVEGLVGPEGVAESIRMLSSKLQREEFAFKVAEEIVYGKFGHMEPEAAADQAIRTALAIFTEGLTAAPLQGVARVAIRTNHDRTRYLALYFAGPMRSAGGTDQALTLVVGDFVRRLLGLERYKPTEEEILRFIEEVRLYERSVARFQYQVSDEELRKALEWIPIEVTGTESNPLEVSSFRNLPRVETNRLRGGALRVVNDGIIGRAPKVSAIIERLGFQGWDWLKGVRKESEKGSTGFMDEVIAGRPIFSFPSRHGGFRLRYGRARNTGLASVGIHPATMLVLQGFLAGGTQLRLELPGKGGVGVPVDTVEPPIVRLKDGSVVRVSVGNFDELKAGIEKVLFLGDILISFGDFLYNNRRLFPSGYVEEWWVEDLRNAISERFGQDLGRVAQAVSISPTRLQQLIEDPFECKPNAREAVTLSLQLHLPLHPRFTFFWFSLPSVKELQMLREWVLASRLACSEDLIFRITGEFDASVKQALEVICLPHRIFEGKIIVEDDDAHALAFCLGCNAKDIDLSSCRTVSDGLLLMSRVSVRDKAPTFVGARMGRPEKAKRREMKPLVHLLFPVGLCGGTHRDLVEASKRGPVLVEIVKRKCTKCGTFTTGIKCPSCNSETVLEKCCPRCGKSVKEDECPVCKVPARSYQRQPVNLKELLASSCSGLGTATPKLLKGVRGLTNETKTPERVEKGVLRAKHDLSVYKDGTIRFDATNAALTHFRPAEIGVTIEKLLELGYVCDARGEPLRDPNQTCELKMQDVIIPTKAASYLVQVASFVDELLVGMYGLNPYYKVGTIEDLVGHLIIGLAPHTCAGVLGRIVGFTRLNLCYAHPVWHSAKRRDCDGDEDALMLALDTLINFSRAYLPSQIGGIMDAPLLLIPIVNTEEVQRQAHDFDVAAAYPVEFYRKTWEHADARHLSATIDLIESRLGTEAQFEGFNFTVPVSDISMGNSESSYKRLKTMVEKLGGQLELAEKIEAVDARRVALKVLTTHFIRDIAGNLRAFSTQAFRCKSCNKRYRRIPLKGKCSVCGGQLTLTVYRGGIEKYLEVALQLIEEYHLPRYYAQRILLMKEEIGAMFEGKRPKQISLADFA